MRVGRQYPTAAMAGLLVWALACAPGEKAPAHLEAVIHDPREIPASDRPTLLLDTAEGLVLGGRSSGTETLRISANDGQTWSVLGTLPIAARLMAVHEGCPDIHRMEITPQGLFHVRGLAPEAPRSLVAEPPVELNGGAFAILSDGRMGVVWIDRARGWPELLFSQSQDHGATWAPSVRVNTESRWKEMSSALLLAHGTEWVVVWPENRDARTLFDLYGSWSADGRRWEKSRRLNDDQQEAFTVGPAAVDDGGSVHVVSQDYRDLSPFGDHDSNIYYARLNPAGKSSMPNVRVNDVTDAPQWGPALARDPRSGGLVAAWLDGRRQLIGDLFMSGSLDGGRTWSPNQIVNDSRELRYVWPPMLAARRAGGAWLTWQETLESNTRAWLRLVTFENPAMKPAAPPPHKASAIPPGPSRGPGAPPPAPPLAPPPGRLEGPLVASPAVTLLRQESFSGGRVGEVHPLAGSWIVREGALLGFGYGPVFAEWGAPAPESFVLEGRFRLDPSQHISAILYFGVRSSPGEGSALTGYQLRNQFRRGALLSRLTFETSGPRTTQPSAAPVVDRWFSIRQGTWYSFRLVVRKGTLDYFLDGRWMLSAQGIDVRSGRILLGADALGPVDWDDLRLYEIESSQPARSR